nr:MAG TPA: hypothetical protein [Caudoviricetes sp.]
MLKFCSSDLISIVSAPFCGLFCCLCEQYRPRRKLCQLFFVFFVNFFVDLLLFACYSMDRK